MDEFAELAILHPENRFKESIENANESVLNRIAPLFKSEVSTNINRNDSSLLVLKILLKSLTYSDSLLCTYERYLRWFYINIVWYEKRLSVYKNNVEWQNSFLNGRTCIIWQLYLNSPFRIQEPGEVPVEEPGRGKGWGCLSSVTNSQRLSMKCLQWSLVWQNTVALSVALFETQSPFMSFQGSMIRDDVLENS